MKQYLKNDINLSEYKKTTKQEFLKGDENFISAIFSFKINNTYIPKK